MKLEVLFSMRVVCIHKKRLGLIIYLYGLKDVDEKDTQEEIGFDHLLIFDFDIPDSIPEDYDVISPLTTLDLKNIPPIYSNLLVVTFIGPCNVILLILDMLMHYLRSSKYCLNEMKI